MNGLKFLCSLMLCVFTQQLYGYKVSVANNTGKEFNLKVSLIAGENVRWESSDGVRFEESYKRKDGKYQFRSRGKQVETKVLPYSIGELKVLNETKGCFEKIELHYSYQGDHGETKYNTFNPMKKKSGCADLYVTVRDKGKGQYQIVAWSGSNADNRYKYLDYIKKHEHEFKIKPRNLK